MDNFPKFRAWIPVLGLMLYDVDVYACGDIGITVNKIEPLLKEKGFYIDWDESAIYSYNDNETLLMSVLTGDEYIWFEKPNFVLMQYIGFTDKDNDEIYVGNMIEYTREVQTNYDYEKETEIYETITSIHEVYFDTENAEFGLKETNVLFCKQFSHEYKIIYENSELLETK